MDEKQDQTSEETAQQDQTSEETAMEKETPEIKPEPINYEEKFKQSQSETIRLRKELDEFKTAPKQELPEEEKKIREILDRAKRDEQKQLLQAEREEERRLDELQEIYGTFDREKFKSFLDDYPAYDVDENIDYHKSFKFFERYQSAPEAPKKKIPSSQRTSETPQKEPYDIHKKSMREIVEDAKREIQ